MRSKDDVPYVVCEFGLPFPFSFFCRDMVTACLIHIIKLNVLFQWSKKLIVKIREDCQVKNQTCIIGEEGSYKQDKFRCRGMNSQGPFRGH